MGKRHKTGRSWRLGLGLVPVAALVVSGGVVAVPGVAAAKGVTVSGSVECRIDVVGDVHEYDPKDFLRFNPPLWSRKGKPHKTSMKVNLPCVSNPVGTVTSAMITAKYYTPASETCSTLGTVRRFGRATFTVKWTGSRTINRTTLVYSSHMRTPFGPPDPIFLQARTAWQFPIFNDDPTPDGTATISGSYAGEFSTLSIVSDLAQDLSLLCRARANVRKIEIQVMTLAIGTNPLF